MNNMQTSVMMESPALDAQRWPVYGHGWVVRLLQMAMTGSEDTSRLRHAYLLTGPQQVGKSTLARAFAQALLCTAATEDAPCGVCRACRLMKHGNHPDFRLIQPLDSDGNADRENGTLRVEQAARIIHEVPQALWKGGSSFF